MDYNNAVEMVLVKEEPEDNENCPVKKELDSVLDSSIETTVKIKEENESNSIETYSIIEDIESTNQPDIQHIKKEAELEGIPNDDFNIECSQNIIDPTKIEEIEVGETFLTKQEDVSGGTDSKRSPRPNAPKDTTMHKCELCNYVTNKKCDMKRHTEIVHLKVKYSCHLCDRSFSRQLYLEKHLESDHLKSKKYELQCDYCDFTAWTKRKIQRHIDVEHIQLVYTCGFCEYKTNTESYLKSHLNQVHTKKKKCDKCDYTTAIKRSLERHRDKHHNIKCYECPNCSYTSQQECLMKRHARVHEKGTLLINEYDFPTFVKEKVKKTY